MIRRELGRAVDKAPVMAVAACLALCSCGQSLQKSPNSARDSLVSGVTAQKTDATKHKATTTTAAKPDAPQNLLGQIPSLGETDAGGLRPISPEQMLDHAQARVTAAKAAWSKGESVQAREETDTGFRLLMLVPSELNETQEARRELIQLQLSRLIVAMSATNAGPLGTETALPLVMNQYVEREIQSFRTTERRFFVESFRRSGTYMPYILKKLEEAHMPAELAWLPLIESSFNPRALSPARALGMWQFIPSTGYRFGLQRDVWVDDRMDPELATVAALEYLKMLHELFGDWSTAVAAYNCGEGGVARAIRGQNNDYLDSFWDIFPNLPYETARYVPRFMATLHIIKDPAKFGFDELVDPYEPWTFELVEISRQTNLRSIARMLNVDAERLEKLNPALRRGSTPPRPYKLRVPVGHSQTLTAKLAEPAAIEILAAADRSESPAEPQPKAAASGPTKYRVRGGDTLSSIARRFRISVTSLARANRLSSKHRLEIGQVLKIPRRGI